MAIQTQPKDVPVHIDPYSFLAEIQVLSGNPVQNYNKDTNDYEPDRSLVPCVLMPYISVQDPEGLMNGSQTITGAEWYEGAPKSDGSNRIVDNDDYAISATGKPTYSLTVKKNVDYNSPIELHCIFSITDKRKNTQEKFERSIVLRTSIFDSNNYSLKINRPKGWTINPLEVTPNSKGEWLYSITAQVYSGEDTVADSNAAYWWQILDGTTWRDFTADELEVFVSGKNADGTWGKTLTLDARFFRNISVRVRGAYYTGTRPSSPTSDEMQATTSIDETKLEENHYNWGYDPANYNVPDGSYSTDPYQPATRVKEFKQMVQALHRAGIRVIMDMVYNHTFNTVESNFERTVPGYFYRQKEDGTLANGSGCGNETASERPMMRKFMIESVLYWIKEYHIDGFRFDLMGVHDIETMNEIRKAVNKVDPTICIYGEGWAADTPQYPADSLAMKGNVSHMPGIAVFSDELRDGLCGPVWKKEKGAFLAGVPGAEMSVKFGIVGAIEHPQVRCDSVNYSQKPWAEQPTQMISYVSCHDGLCLVDRLKASMPGVTPEQLVRLDKLAQTVVFTSQGIPFIYAGEEVMRDKQGVDNSYKSPDAVNAIDWRRKTTNGDVFMYYKRLIDLRKSHPAFRMGDAEKVRKHLEFLPVEGQNLIAFRLKDHANGDSWEDIIVAFNSRMTPARLEVPVGKYTVVCKDGVIDVRGLGTQIGPEVIIPGQSALIMYK